MQGGYKGKRVNGIQAKDPVPQLAACYRFVLAGSNVHYAREKVDQAFAGLSTPRIVALPFNAVAEEIGLEPKARIIPPKKASPVLIDKRDHGRWARRSGRSARRASLHVSRVRKLLQYCRIDGELLRGFVGR